MHRHRTLAACHEIKTHEPMDRKSKFNAHNDQRRNHQIIANVHESIKPNVFVGLTQLSAGPDTKLNTRGKILPGVCALFGLPSIDFGCSSFSFDRLTLFCHAH